MATISMDNPQDSLDQKWAKEQDRITHDWYNSGQRATGFGPAGSQQNQTYDDYLKRITSDNPLYNNGLQRAKEDFMRGEFGNAQNQAVANQRNLAQQFRQGMPGYEQNIYDQINANAKYSIADQQNQIKRAANQRGLLYSGLKTGSMDAAAADISSKAAGQRSQVAPALEKQANELDQRAIETAQAKQVSDLNLANNVFDRALQDAQAAAAATGQMMNTGGQLVGTIAGNYFSKKK